MDKRMISILERMRIKLDELETDIQNKEKGVKRKLRKMIHSLDRIVYDPNYFGKFEFEISMIRDLKPLFEIDNPTKKDIQYIKQKLDTIIPTRIAKMRLEYC